MCLAYLGFGAPFVCLGLARPCFSSQGCECHHQPCHALDLRLGPVVHMERFLWSPRRLGVKIRRKMARLCSSFRQAPWPVPHVRSWLLRAAGLLFVPFRSVLGLPLSLTLHPLVFPVLPRSLEMLPYVQRLREEGAPLQAQNHSCPHGYQRLAAVGELGREDGFLTH